MLSRGLFVVVAMVAVVATVSGVLVLSGRDDSDSGGASANAAPADPALAAKMRRLQFYDWEPNVIGPRGRPAPGDAAVTGGTNAGRTGSLSLYDAVLRASRRPARVEPDNGRTTSLYYVVDRKRRRVFGRGEPSRVRALAAVPAARRAVVRVYEVRPGTAIVGAEGSPRRWYVLEDDVALRGTELRNPRRATDPVTGRPVVLFEFTEPGRVRFQQLTRTMARRGAASSLQRIKDDPSVHNQHFAVVLDRQIVTTPFVDFRLNPDGLDGRAGAQLSARLP
ncbi:MAG: SecDF P1 head subdomain-containing protein [Solirubrobacteraceae bacterium]